MWQNVKDKTLSCYLQVTVLWHNCVTKFLNETIL